MVYHQAYWPLAIGLWALAVFQKAQLLDFPVVPPLWYPFRSAESAGSSHTALRLKHTVEALVSRHHDPPPRSVAVAAVGCDGLLGRATTSTCWLVCHRTSLEFPGMFKHCYSKQGKTP